MKKILCALMISAVIPTMALADGIDENLRESAAGSYYGKYNSSTYKTKKNEVVAGQESDSIFYVTPRSGVAAGVYLTDNVRADVEIGYHFEREMAIERTPDYKMISDARQVDILANAYYDGTPLILITGQVNSKLIGGDAFQEADIVGITRSCCKHNYLVKDVKDLARIIKEAFYIATTGKKGPVVIDIPVDIFNSKHKFCHQKFLLWQNIFHHSHLSLHCI